LSEGVEGFAVGISLLAVTLLIEIEAVGTFKAAAGKRVDLVAVRDCSLSAGSYTVPTSHLVTGEAGKAGSILVAESFAGRVCGCTFAVVSQEETHRALCAG
jgi:hypothetical protein